ncbi:hypothetical protein EDD85DRAFT_794337 [Armillaria nabsnona]|nr:hypothetical protein EDD85DRAFT_794337 [Armillaria nabsnona]
MTTRKCKVPLENQNGNARPTSKGQRRTSDRSLCAIHSELRHSVRGPKNMYEAVEFPSSRIERFPKRRALPALCNSIVVDSLNEIGNKCCMILQVTLLNGLAFLTHHEGCIESEFGQQQLESNTPNYLRITRIRKRKGHHEAWNTTLEHERLSIRWGKKPFRVRKTLGRVSIATMYFIATLRKTRQRIVHQCIIPPKGNEGEDTGKPYYPNFKGLKRTQRRLQGDEKDKRLDPSQQLHLVLSCAISICADGRRPVEMDPSAERTAETVPRIDRDDPHIRNGLWCHNLRLWLRHESERLDRSGMETNPSRRSRRKCRREKGNGKNGGERVVTRACSIHSATEVHDSTWGAGVSDAAALKSSARTFTATSESPTTVFASVGVFRDMANY